MLSHVSLFVTPWTGACQAPLSMGLSKQEYWSALPFPSPGDFSQPRDWTHVSCIGRHSLPLVPPGKPIGGLHHNLLINSPTERLDFPGGSNSKESACNVGDLGSIPGWERSPGEGNEHLLQYSCLEIPHGQRSLAGCSPRGRKESDTTKYSTAWSLIYTF